MGFMSVFENFNLTFNCFGKEKHDDKALAKNLYYVSKQHKISVLPITPTFDIENLYPLTDGVGLWNIFVVGNDKTYILSQVNDPSISIPEAQHLLNRKANGVLPDDLTSFFDSVWDRTLGGRQLQFYMVWNGKLYFINSYPFFNGKRVVIGATLFMRAFDSMPPQPMDQRASIDLQSAAARPQLSLYGSN